MFMDIDPNGVDDSRFTVPAKCHTVSSIFSSSKDRDFGHEFSQYLP